ncbi:MAG: 30S ribosomal protein S21 [Candidatus Promineifilaceae bacterium]
MSKLAKVVLRSNETPEQLLRRFNKEVTKSRVLADVRRKRWHVPKSELRRIAKKKAIRRQKRVSKQNDTA